ncbi:MAG: bifunctional shikimate kinase/3-dehydroquinate synthase [Chloroflexota bacterium]
MDVVLVGLPGSGKSVIGRRVAHRHDAAFIDLDERIEAAAGRTIPQLFEDEGEAGFRARERAAVVALGHADRDPAIKRVVATGGGTIVDPRNRWHLYRGRLPIWLDGRPEVLAQRLRRSTNVRPLVAGRDPIGSIRDLGRKRERFYGAAIRVRGVAEVGRVIERVDEIIATHGSASAGGHVLLRADTAIGSIVLGEGIAASEVAAALVRLGARRAILVSEPGAWSAFGEALAGALERGGLTTARVMLPQGEAAKRLSVVERAAGDLAALRVERGEPIVAIGGGAVGDAAGFLAATYLRGIPVIHVPTTLVAQIDSSIGGKTGVDLDAGKNLVGAYHQPAAVVIDTAALRTLPERERRAALGEAVKMAALGDERLFELLEIGGEAIARGDPAASETGAVAELVERAAWAKVEVVLADEREAAGRIALNLGHSVGHAIEAAAGFSEIRHGEAVAHGLRAACRIGVAHGVTPADRAERIERLLDALGLATEQPALGADDVLGRLAVDKKHASGRLRWVLPTAGGHEVRDDVPDEVVRRIVDELLAASVGSAER